MFEGTNKKKGEKKGLVVVEVRKSNYSQHPSESGRNLGSDRSCQTSQKLPGPLHPVLSPIAREPRLHRALRAAAQTSSPHPSPTCVLGFDILQLHHLSFITHNTDTFSSVGVGFKLMVMRILICRLTSGRLTSCGIQSI
jgi:hypothetical protein